MDQGVGVFRYSSSSQQAVNLRAGLSTTSAVYNVAQGSVEVLDGPTEPSPHGATRPGSEKRWI